MSLVSWLLFPLSIVGAAFLVGLITEWLVIAALRRSAARRPERLAAILSQALRNHITLWLTIAGAFVALESIHLDEQRLLDNIRTALLVVLVISLTTLAARVVANLVTLSVRRANGRLPASMTFSRLARYAIITIGAMVVLQTLTIPITPLLTTLGVASLAIGLALQAPLTNLFSGIYILMSGKIRPGNYVRLTNTGQEGYVLDTDFQHTTIRELPNNVIIIPNASLAAAEVRNFHLPETEMAVLVDVGVSLDSDLEHVERVTTEVAHETLSEVTGGVADFEPFIRFSAFEDFRIRFTVILRAHEFVDQFLIKHEFIKRLQSRYRREGIEIPVPLHTVQLREPVAYASTATKD